MSTLLLVGKWVSSASFTLLALVTFAQWVNRRDLRNLYLALSDPATPAPMVVRYTLAAAASRHHLLVVDDSPDNQRVATRMLEKMGYRVDVASNGVEAVAAVSRGGTPRC